MKTSWEPTKECHSPSDITRMKSLVTVDTTLHCTLKRIQGGEQEWGTLCSGGWGWGKKAGKTGVQLVKYFQDKFLWTKFLVSSHT